MINGNEIKVTCPSQATSWICDAKTDAVRSKCYLCTIMVVLGVDEILACILLPFFSNSAIYLNIHLI